VGVEGELALVIFEAGNANAVFVSRRRALGSVSFHTH
jgi:hypothetical protein